MIRQKSNNKRKKSNDFIRYSSLGFEMMAIIAFGTFGGYKIDQWLNNDFYWFTFILMIVSVVVSILYGIRNLLKK
ncbi:MAG: AtpZ/AtpI family protein [Mariniphaga sp.]|nr:AtpZ/AtpI family protein [Mariniphaga sp.]